MALLQVNDVTMKFGQLVACDRVTFELNQGEMIGLIGPNGAGKTTLFNCITGFYQPVEGSVYFDGQDITGASPHSICHLGAVRTFQIVETLQEMTVLENVMVGAFVNYPRTGEARDKALETLDLCGLLDEKDTLAANLTIAHCKRLELARALSTEPTLLMLDEAMAGLTLTEVREAVELLSMLRDQGLTMLVVEHVMEAIMPIADRIVVLDNGAVIAIDIPEEIAENERVIKAYLGERYHVADR